MNTTRIAQAVRDIEKYQAALKWLEEFGSTQFDRNDITVRTHTASACNGHKEAMEVLTAYAWYELPKIIETSIKACKNTIEIAQNAIREEVL